MIFGLKHMGLAPSEFWQLTFAEWRPMVEAIIGKQEKPMTKTESNSLTEEYLKQFKKG